MHFKSSSNYRNETRRSPHIYESHMLKSPRTNPCRVEKYTNSEDPKGAKTIHIYIIMLYQVKARETRIIVACLAFS